MILSLILISLGYFAIDQRKQQLKDKLRVHGESLVDLLAETSIQPIKKYSFFLLQEFAIKIEQFDYVAFCEIYNSEGLSLVQDEITIEGRRIVKKKRRVGDNIMIFEKKIIDGDQHLGRVEVGFFLDDLNEEIRISSFQFGIGFFVLLGVMAIVIDLFLSIFFVSPIIKLSAEMNGFTPENYTPMSVNRNDEIGLLISSFNQMGKNLQNSFKKIREEVAVRKEAEDNLKAVNQILERSIRRSESIRIFANQITKHKNESILFCATLEEIYQHLHFDGTILFFDFEDNLFSNMESQRKKPSILKKPFSSKIINSVFTSDNQEVSVFNEISDNHPLFHLTVDQIIADLNGSHFLFFKASAAKEELICIYRSPEKPHFDELDEEYIKSMLNQIDIAQKNIGTIEEKTRMETELKTASIIQKSFLPKKIPKIPGYEIALKLQPAKEVSGDYYDIIELPENRTAIMVADVSGKGMPAAIYVNLARVILRNKAKIYGSPFQTLCALNEGLKGEFNDDTQANRFLTLCYLTVGDNNVVQYANAGHEPIQLIRKNEDKYQLLKPHGYPLGNLYTDIFSERLSQETVSLNSGDVLFCFSDGATDVENDYGKQFDEERLYDLVKQYSHLTAQQITDNVYKGLMKYQGKNEQTDDITLVVLKKT